jgi:hypothetical protein
MQAIITNEQIRDQLGLNYSMCIRLIEVKDITQRGRAKTAVV